MRIITEPSVYIIGRQTVDDGNLDRFLTDHGIAWESDSEVAAEVLTETAGRLCYWSYAKPRPGGNAAYLHHIKEAQHGSICEHAVWTLLITGVSRSLSHELIRHRAGTGFCLAGDTKVYSGSKCNGRFDGVKKTWTLKKLHQWTTDPKRKGRISLIKVRCFDGTEFVQAGIRSVVASGVKQLFKVELADGKSIRCSADHRFLTPDGWKPVCEMSVGEPLGTNGLPAIVLSRDDLATQYGPERKTLAEIAAVYNCSTHTIRKWLKRFGLQKPIGTGMTGRVPPNKGTRYTTGYRHTEETKALLSIQKRQEKNHRWKGDNASADAGRLRALKMYPSRPCESCGKENGHRHHRDRNTHNNAIENIEFLCGSCHTKRHYLEDGPTNALTVKWVAIASITPDGIEETFDIEVNHPSHNFVANGFVTHNSQLSQRYVDESVAEYIEPAIIMADPELHAIWFDAVKHSHAAYVKLADRLLILEYNRRWPQDGLETAEEVIKSSAYRTHGTAIRKAARQAARSVLPNATETKLVITANARALRNMLEQRCTLHAEPEIRQLFGKVWELMVKESPALFGDYVRVPLPDGTFELSTPFRKV